MDDTKAPHTYAAGEDASRLASAAKEFGLENTRKTLKPSQWNLIFDHSALIAAGMHSVGILGSDERLDRTGKLHSHRAQTIGQKPEERQFVYGALEDLFHSTEQMEVVDEEDEEEFDDENEEVEVVKGGSLAAAIFGIVKATVGPAILYLPRGFEHSGWVVAIFSMLLSLTVFVFSAYRLLECWRVERERNSQWAAKIEGIRKTLLRAEPSLGNYGSTDTKEETSAPKMLNYPELARRSLGGYSCLVDIAIAANQFGVCLTYLIFVPQNLYECTRQLFGIEVNKLYFLLVMVIIEIPLVWIRDIRKLTPFNVMATLLIAYGLMSIIIMAFGTGLSYSDNGRLNFAENLEALPAATDAWFLFIGTSFFMVEGTMTLIVPLQDAIYREQDKAKFPGTVARTMPSIICFYMFFSIICCGGFGDDIHTALTASLPEGFFATSVQIGYSIAVIFTFPLQAFPAMEVVSRATLGTINPSSLTRNALATILTCFLGVTAVYAIDSLGNVVSILGALFGIPLGLVFPSVMHLILVKNLSSTAKCTNYVVILIGCFAMSAASYATLANWAQGAEGG
mmetsp:Transcript_5441/g.7879  ORF Transcript_5441/g.7879 Transcript_5441/m.7879 type:complete len:567 (-) Transcript_5441:63-1763(-)|eukprot:CAMPEP_0194199744 /NCGR_PEP_ID=MMETSP0156-20130528/645_1 /TAXON_ID=33649 /ORGANISM="Thalassionema nitzschioides, Strain L26-B" /LENGTH=566 /DNA_ID=CAMNT_0038924679 /DNA_START=40 /DNA_END=1740 /DNA_ORIENTATION=-